MTIPRKDGSDDLRIADLTLRFGAVSALEGVSLTVPSEGSNGGKTSLLRAICGSFRFHGHPSADPSAAAIAI